MKLISILLFSLVTILFINGCTAQPRLKAYVPKENIKVVYVTKDDEPAEVSFPDMDSSKTQAQTVTAPKAIITPSLKITSLSTTPNAVMQNQAFDIEIDFEINVSEKKDKLDVVFFFTIAQDNEVLFTSETTTLKATNGLSESFNVHMDPVPVSGEYRVKAVITYKKLSSEKSIELSIQP
jgi:hypothetical protein